MEFAGCRMAAGIFFAQRRVPLAFRAHGAYNNAYFLIRDLRPVCVYLIFSGP